MERFLLLVIKVVSSRLPPPPREEEEEEEEHRTSGSSTADDAAARMWSCDRAKTTGLCVSSLSLSLLCVYLCVRGWLRLSCVVSKKRGEKKNKKKGKNGKKYTNRTTH